MTPRKSLNPAWAGAVRAAVNASPYFTHLSIVLTELARGRARVEIPVQYPHTQRFGVVHGGVYSTLVETAGFWACYSMLEPGVGLEMVDMQVNLLAAARGGRLVATGRCLKVGRSLGLAETRVEDQDGALLAQGTVTVRALPGEPLSGLGELPDKVGG